VSGTPIRVEVFCSIGDGGTAAAAADDDDDDLS
jgi:hypothetical protein